MGTAGTGGTTKVLVLSRKEALDTKFIFYRIMDFIVSPSNFYFTIKPHSSGASSGPRGPIR